LGEKSNLKIDAVAGAPTKVTMLKFNIGVTMNQVLKNVGVSLKSAKLALYAKNTGTTDQFGGYIEEIDTNWSEETTVWHEYVKGGPASKKDAEKLLPSANDTLASFEAVSPSKWAEADVTERFQEIVADWSKTAVSQFAVRMTTDKSEGVVYASKENIQFGPKLSLLFEFEGTSLEVAAAAAAASSFGETIITSKPTSKATSNPTNVPTVVPSPLPTPLPSSSPTSSPVLSTASPAIQTESPVATTSTPFVATSPPTTLSPVVNTPLPTSTPSRPPSPLPTPLPTTAVVTEEPTETSATTVTTATSVVSQMFQLKIAVTTEEVRGRKLRGTRELSSFMSLDEKERPALEKHLMNVYNESLTSSPERVDVTFVNDDMDVNIVSINKVVRSNAFKISAIFLDPRIASIAANEASAVLDRATLHAFTGAENTAFVSILKETGDPIISSSEQITVDVSKMSFSIGPLSDQSIQSATVTEASANAGNKSSKDAAGWAGPALAICASLVIMASALASFILIRQRRNLYSYDGKHKNATNKPSSPTNTEAVTPSPTSFAGRFQKKKKKFDYTEFDDPEDMSINLDYDLSPVTPQKFVKEQPADLDCPPNIKFSHFQCRSFDDSTVSNVSAHIHAGMLFKSPQRITTVADSDKSGIESQFRFDNILGNDNDLQVDGSTPNFLVDDDSASDIPSELYNMSMDDSATVQSHDLAAVYGAKTFMLDDMIKTKGASFMDMPPPPSDAASENSSQQDFPSDPFYENYGSGESYQKEINDELNKVMLILNEPTTEDDKMENEGDDNSEDHGSIGDPIFNIYDVPYLQSATSRGAAAHADGSVQSSVLSEDDPAKLMSSALDDCMAILDKARPNVDIV